VRGGAVQISGESDASDLGEVRSEGESEGPGARIGVYEVGWRWRARELEEFADADMGRKMALRTYEVKRTSASVSG
jgi:hypothetical protein